MHLTLQKNEGYNEKSYKRTAAVQKCGDRPYEIALRFAGCSLYCGACFASGYSWPDRYRTHYRVIEDVNVNRVVKEFLDLPTPPTGSYNWMRILGGEPLLNDEYVNYLFDFITKASEKDASKFKEGIIIQTNGIHIGRGNSYVLRKRLEELHSVNPDVLVVIETSIKGSNENEFQLISRSSESLYEYNIQSYYELLDLDLPNLRPVVIAGLGVNESFLLKKGRSKYAISILYDEDTPIFHPSIWDVKFSELYDDFTARYEKLNPRFRRMPMYGIKDQFQYGWVKRAIRQTKEIYGDRVYDATYADRNYTVEKKFYDVLEKFFYPGNQQYYSTLIGR